MELLPSKTHLSYKNHRRQFWLQIFLPMLISILFIILIAVVIGLTVFGENSSDPSRWAAISMIWLVIPVVIFGVVLFAILGGLIYLMARTLGAIPTYTSKAQYYVERASDIAQRVSNTAAKPVIFLEGITASIKAFFGKK